MGELTQRLMVTGGNVTGITDMLEEEGLVLRETDPEDQRAFRVKLTKAGEPQFQRMAAAHERWVVDLFEDLTGKQKNALAELLAALKMSTTRAPRRSQRSARMNYAKLKPQHFLWRLENKVGLVTLESPGAQESADL